MRLRGQNLDLASLIDTMPYFPTDNDLGDSFAPQTFVDKIDVPTFLVASWQDEQVGGHAPTMIPRLRERAAPVRDPHQRAPHRGPGRTRRCCSGGSEFLQLYVAKRDARHQRDGRALRGGRRPDHRRRRGRRRRCRSRPSTSPRT